MFKLLREITTLPIDLISNITTFTFPPKIEIIHNWNDVNVDFEFAAADAKFLNVTVMDICRNYNVKNWVRNISGLLILGSYARECAISQENFIRVFVDSFSDREKLAKTMDIDIINMILFSIYNDVYNSIHCKCFEHNCEHKI